MPGSLRPLLLLYPLLQEHSLLVRWQEVELRVSFFAPAAACCSATVTSSAGRCHIAAYLKCGVGAVRIGPPHSPAAKCGVRSAGSVRARRKVSSGWRCAGATQTLTRLSGEHTYIWTPGRVVRVADRLSDKRSARGKKLLPATAVLSAVASLTVGVGGGCRLRGGG